MSNPCFVHYRSSTTTFAVHFPIVFCSIDVFARLLYALSAAVEFVALLWYGAGFGFSDTTETTCRFFSLSYLKVTQPSAVL